MKPITKVLIALLLSLGCHAALYPAIAEQRPEEIADSGNAFMRECSELEKGSEQLMKQTTTAEQGDFLLCLGYIRGLVDGIIAARPYHADFPFCPPVEGIEVSQHIRILMKYFRDHPAQTHLKTRVLYIAAMADAFPCASRK